MSRAYITQYFCLSPLGLNSEQTRNSLLSGRTCITEFDHQLLPDSIPIRYLGLIPGQVLPFIGAHEIYNEALLEQKKKWLDLFFSSFTEEDDRELTSVIFVHNFGSNVFSYMHLRDHQKNTIWPTENYSMWCQNDFESRYKNKNINYISFHNTCAGVASAVAYAKKRIQLGYDKKIKVIALEISNHYWPGFITLHSLGVVNTKAANVNQAILPFGLNRSGFAKADAIGYLMIESEDLVQKKGLQPYCEIAGQSMTSDSHSLTDGVEDGSMVEKTMQNALDDARIQATDINYINAHGTGTYLNDLIEVRAIKRLFKDKYQDVYVGSTKSQYGHALCASGLVEISSILEMFQGHFLAANINSDLSDKECDLNFVKNVITNHATKYAIKNSFGFGGYNASLVLKNSRSLN